MTNRTHSRFTHDVLRICLVVVAMSLVAPLSAGSPEMHGAAYKPGPPAPPMRDAFSYVSPYYPHLASYNGLSKSWQVPFYAHDDLLVARLHAPIKELTRANPRALTLLYERTIQTDLCCTADLYGVKPEQIPARWWLLSAGSTLVNAIDASQQWLTVADPRRFARCQDIMIDSESMHVWGMEGRLLHVLRGYHSKAAPHRAGVRVAPHYSYRVDRSNCRLSGAAPSLRPWSFNLSAACPRWHGQRWIDFLAHRVAYLVRRDGWRGIFYDNMPDLPQSPLVDANNDNVPDGGVIDGANAWRNGERALLAETRRLLPGVPLMVNGDLVMDGLADGREMEQFPLIPGIALGAGIDSYLYDGAAGMPLTIVNGDTTAHPRPSSSQAALTTGVALLGNGYAAYDYGWIEHGYPWWFDEYDGGLGSALTGAVDEDTSVFPVAHPERFRVGDVVLVDREAVRVLSVLAGALLVERGVLDTASAQHFARAVLTTAAQRAAGHGYLGRPLGPARIVPTSDWSREILPLSVAHSFAAPTPVHSATETQISPSRVSYDPGAVRLILLAPAQRGALRTLVFSARGPAGHALWVSCDGLAVPLVLRATWHRYVLPMCGARHIALEAGRAGGTVRLRGMQLIGRQAYVWRRDFRHGSVFVNPTDVPQRLVFPAPLHVLAGDANPSADDGHLTHTVSLARYQAQVFVNK